MKTGNFFDEIGDKSLVTPERDGTLKNLPKKTYLTCWIGTLDLSGNETLAHLNNEGSITVGKSVNMDFARLKIENATLKESIENMEHLTSSIHRLRLSLYKVKESATSEDPVNETLNDIINEAKLIKTSLGAPYQLVGQPRQMSNPLRKEWTVRWVIFMETPSMKR